MAPALEPRPHHATRRSASLRPVRLGALTLGLLAGACAAAGPGTAPARADLSAAEAAAGEARRADLGMNDAVAARDGSAFGRFVADEALFFGGEGPASGRAAVVAAWAPFLTPGGPSLTWAPDRAEASASGDLVLTWGGWTWRGADGATEAGRYLTAWQREADGALRAVLDADAAPLPALPPGVAREVLRTVRSADGRLVAEGGLLRGGEAPRGHFVQFSRVEDGLVTVLADAGRLR